MWFMSGRVSVCVSKYVLLCLLAFMCVCVCVYVNAVVSMFAQISSLGRWEGGVRVWVYGGGVGGKKLSAERP